MGKTSPSRSAAQESPEDGPPGPEPKSARERSHAGDRAPQRSTRKDFVRARNRVLDRRARVGRGRLRLQKKRFRLRWLREEVSEVEATFLAALEQSSLQQVEDRNASLPKLFEQVRRLQEKIRKKEDAYDQDEDAVDKEEFMLEAEEREFYETFEPEMAFVNGAKSLTSSTSSSFKPSSMKDNFAPAYSNPLHEYETKVGEANILRERLNEICLAREEYLEQKRQDELRGLVTDQVVLGSLNAVAEGFARTAGELAAVERDIQVLEQPALENGLELSSAYSRLVSYLPDPAIFEQQALAQQDTASESGYIVPVPVQFQRTAQQSLYSSAARPFTRFPMGNSLVNQAKLRSRDYPHSAKSSRAEIYQWLQGLPSPIVELSNHNHSWMRSIHNCKNWFVGFWKKDDRIEPPDILSDHSLNGPEQLWEGWVYIKPTDRPRLCPDTDMNPPVRPHSVEVFRSPSDCSVEGEEQELDITAGPLPPNASHATPLYGLEPGVDDRESRSI